MKKILLFVLTALMFTACDNSGKNQPEPSVLQDSAFPAFLRMSGWLAGVEMALF